MREFNAILRLCGVSRTAQSFLSPCWKMQTCPGQSWTWALEEAKVDFGQSLVTCPEVPQKRDNLLSRQH